MRKTLFRLFILSLCVSSLSPAVGEAQPLDTLLAMARRDNPDLRMSDLQYQAGLERRDQVNQLPDPEVGAGVFLLPIETRVGPQRLRLHATQRLPWMGTLQAREDLAIARTRDDYLNTELIRLNMEYAIRQAYYQLYELDETQEVLRRNLGLLQSLEGLSLARVESGEASAADVLRVQLRINRTEQEIQRLENGKNKPRANLNEALNRPVNTPVTVADTLSFASLALNRDTLLNYLRANHPGLRQLAVKQAIAEEEIALNELNYKPGFAVGLDYILTGKRKDAEISQNGKDALMVRAAVNVPIFSRQYEAREREERLRIDALEQQKQSLENSFMSDLEKAYTDYRDAALQLELYQDQQGIVSSALDILTTRYSNEGTGFDELLNLYIEQFEYELGIVRAVVKSHLALAAIDRLVRLN